jgi:hypothetical protein
VLWGREQSGAHLPGICRAGIVQRIGWEWSEAAPFREHRTSFAFACPMGRLLGATRAWTTWASVVITEDLH